MDSFDNYLHFTGTEHSSLPVRVCSAGVLRYDPTWVWSMDGYANLQYVFWIIVDGKGSLRAGSDEFSLRRGECILSPMSDAHHGLQQAGALLCIPWTVFEYLDPASGAPRRPEPHPVRRRVVQDVEALRGLVERAAEAHLAGRADHASLWMSVALLEVAQQDCRPPLHGQQHDQYAAVEELAQRIRRAPGAPYTLASMATAVHYSADHLVRLFRRYRGVTPIEYVIRCRMEQARSLLLFSGQPVRSIAATLGYDDVSYFTRQFCRRMGLPPAAYRRSGGAQRAEAAA